MKMRKKYKVLEERKKRKSNFLDLFAIGGIGGVLNIGFLTMYLSIGVSPVMSSFISGFAVSAVGCLFIILYLRGYRGE